MSRSLLLHGSMNQNSGMSAPERDTVTLNLFCLLLDPVFSRPALDLGQNLYWNFSILKVSLE